MPSPQTRRLGLLAAILIVIAAGIGVRLLPLGLPREVVKYAGSVLRAWLEKNVLPEFSSRTLPVDVAVARRCARLHVPDRRSERDAFIAATALVHGMSVVTRNVADFEPTGVAIINPWAG